MKKNEIMQKYSLTRGAWDALWKLGKIQKLSPQDFQVDETFIKTFNYNNSRTSR